MDELNVWTGGEVKVRPGKNPVCRTGDRAGGGTGGRGDGRRNELLKLLLETETSDREDWESPLLGRRMPSKEGV
jgi:hypothetical protein